MRLPGGGTAVALNGLHRAIAGAAETDARGRLFVEVDERPDEAPAGEDVRELETEYRAVVEEILELRGDDGRIAAFVRSISEPGALADTSGYSPDLTFEQKVQLLEAVDVTERLELALGLPARAADADAGAPAHPRGRRTPAWRSSSASTSCASSSTRSARSSARTRRPSSRSTAPRSPSRRCPTTCASRPSASSPASSAWARARPRRRRSAATSTGCSPCRGASAPRSGSTRRPAREVLDADHAGLEDVKDRIVEYIAVRKLRQERGIEPDKKSGAILTLIGPPGTGKTSIGESIARSLNREFVRMSLGGVRDEAEIRGHRRTYIGALPGRLVRALRDAEDDEPGDPARRGRQGRRRLARRPVGGAARGARPGAELTRSATTTSTSSSTSPRSSSSRRRTRPTRSPARCSTGWR